MDDAAQGKAAAVGQPRVHRPHPSDTEQLHRTQEELPASPLHRHVTRFRNNAPMSATARALALLSRLEEDSAWRLLRANNAPVVAAILAEHLGSEQDRLDADDLYELIDADLEQLRSHGLELKQTARAYVAEWRNAGFLIRRAIAETRGETLELSGASTAALRFLESLEAPRRSATESPVSYTHLTLPTIYSV